MSINCEEYCNLYSTGIWRFTCDDCGYTVEKSIKQLPKYIRALIDKIDGD